jgi:hypothetical protein
MTTDDSSLYTATFAPIKFPVLKKLEMTPESACFYENDTSYNSAAYLIEYFNSNLNECCQICTINQYCLSWILFPVENSNYTCRLFDSFRPSPTKQIGYQSGFNQKSISISSLI